MFKKRCYINFSDVESSMRKSSLRRNSSLRIKSRSSYVWEDDKYFLGYERESVIDFVRLKTPFEIFIPRLIVQFDKNNFSSYTLRLGLLGQLVSIFWLVFLFISIFFSIVRLKLESSVINITFLLAVFAVLVFFEFYLLKKAIKKAIDNN